MKKSSTMRSLVLVALAVLAALLVVGAAPAAAQAVGSQPCLPSATADDLVPTNPGIVGLTGQTWTTEGVAAASASFVQLGCSERASVFTQTQPYTGPNSTVVGGVPPVAPQVDTWPRTNCPHLAGDLTPFEQTITDVLSGGSYVVTTGNKLLLRACSLPAASQTDANFILTRLTVQNGATLVFDDSAMILRVREIVVEAGGQLLAGSATCRLFSKIQIVFHGSAATSGLVGDTTGKPTKGLLSNGITAFHGKLYHPTWTRLARTVTPTKVPTSVMNDSSIIYLQEAVNWEVGQQIVVTTSILWDCNTQWAEAWCKPVTSPALTAPIPQQNEVRTIIGLAHAPHLPSTSTTRFTALQLNQSLAYMHWGGKEYQSEVALLSRRIQMDGEESNDGFGGHIRIQGSNAEGRFAGVSGNNLGQLNQMARYPFHFHMMGDSARTAASYIEDCSVTNTQFRCFTIHGTNRTRLSRNTAFNAVGNCYYLEDGVEEHNLLDYNFAAHVHPIFRPANGGGNQAGETFTSSASLIIPADTGASGFYALNAYNSWVGNAASGGWTGFAFPNAPYRMGLFKGTLGPDATSPIPLNPMARPLVKFIGNTAHSAGFYWKDHGSCMYVGAWFTSDSAGVLTYISGRKTRDTMTPDKKTLQMTFEHSKIWMCNKAVAHWGNTGTVENSEAHDVRMGAMLFGNGAMVNYLINARTANDPAVGGSGRSDLLLARENYGFQFYDTWSRALLSGVIFRNFRAARGSYAIAPVLHSDKFTSQGINSVRGLVYENTDGNAKYLNNYCPYATCKDKRSSVASSVNSVFDYDGSMSGTGRPSIVGSWSNWWNHSPETPCVFNANLTAWTCDWKQNTTTVFFTPQVDGLRNCDATMCTPWDGQTANFRVGRMSQWGTDTTRGIDLSPFASSFTGATGHSNTGWYWRVKSAKYGVDGAPSAFTINREVQIPRGAFVVMAVSYPPTANFTVRIHMESWGYVVNLPMASSLAHVLAPTEVLKPASQFTCAAWWDQCTNTGGSGPSWYFDSASGYLYMRIVNIACYNNNQRYNCENQNGWFNQGGIQVPQIGGSFSMSVAASCPGCVVQSVLKASPHNVTFWQAPDVAPQNRFPTQWGETRTKVDSLPADVAPTFTKCAAPAYYP